MRSKLRNRDRLAYARTLTREVPWIMLVDVHLLDDLYAERLPRHLPAEVERDELLVGRVEPEPREHHFVFLLVSGGDQRFSVCLHLAHAYYFSPKLLGHHDLLLVCALSLGIRSMFDAS